MKEWISIIQDLLKNHKATKDGNNLVYTNINITDFNWPGELVDLFDICCYTNKETKLKTLYKQYFNKESWDNMLLERENNPVNICKISMIGGPKWGTTKNNKHCMEYITVDHVNFDVYVYFRNSDFFKKFLIDMYFVDELMCKYKIPCYHINCKFRKLTLRIPFAYIYLNELYKEGMNVKNDPLFQPFIDYCKSIKDKKQSWKSLERANRYMKKTRLYKEVLKDLI